MKLQYDAIVVGGGPAGASAAYRLSRVGLKVLILEKEGLPRYKACGGGLRDDVLKQFDFDLTPVLQGHVDRVAVALQHRVVLDVRFSKPIGWNVMRSEFDYYLVRHAAMAGAVVHDREPVRQLTFAPDRVEVITDRAKYSSAFVIGADGANGIVAKCAGLSPVDSYAVAVEMEIDVSEGQLAVWRNSFYFDLDFATLPMGGAWIFPKKDHLSVGIGINGTRLKQLKSQASPKYCGLPATLNRWIDGEAALRNGGEILTRGHRLPFRARNAPLHGSRVVLVGDAAGLIHPISGEGIYYAIRSGQIAASAICKVLDSGSEDLSDYTRTIDRALVAEFAGSKGLLRVSRNASAIRKNVRKALAVRVPKDNLRRPVVRLQISEQGMLNSRLVRSLGKVVWRSMLYAGRLLER